MDSAHSSLESQRSRWLKRLLFVLPALSVAGLVWFLTHRAGPAPTTDPVVAEAEILRAELELKTGRLHRMGSTNFFTGWMLELYPDGSSRSRSAVSNGLLHGVSEGRYTNGQIQVTEHFKEGVSHGPRTKWYADGTQLSEAMIVDGRLHGPFRRWHPNGQLAEEVGLKDGQPDGLSTAYFPSGFLKSRAMMRNGDVVEQQHWKDGDYQDSMAELPVAHSSTSGSDRR